MTLQEFLDELAALKPSAAVLRNEGMTEDFVQLVGRTFQLRPKENQQSAENLNPIAELVGNYESEYIRFGEFSLMDSVKRVDGFNVFAVGKYSYLGYVYEDSEIIEYDFEEGEIRGSCAKNITAFLDVLLCVMELHSKRLQGASKNDREINKTYLARSVKAAGGEKYDEFWEAIING